MQWGTYVLNYNIRNYNATQDNLTFHVQSTKEKLKLNENLILKYTTYHKHNIRVYHQRYINLPLRIGT